MPENQDWLDAILAKEPPKEEGGDEETKDVQGTQPESDTQNTSEEDVNTTEDEDDTVDVDEEVEEDDEEYEEEYEEEDDEEDERQVAANKKFAEMRANNTKMTRLLERAAKAEGITLEEFEKRLEDAAIEREAKAEGMSPEALRRLEEKDKHNAELYQKLRIQETTQKLQVLEDNYDLDQEDIKEFVRDMQESGINVLESNIDFEAYFIGMHFNEIAAEMRDIIIQDYLAQEEEDKGASVTTFTGAPETTPGKVDTVEKLDALLDGLSK